MIIYNLHNINFLPNLELHMLGYFSKTQTSQNSECNNSFFDKHFDTHCPECFKIPRSHAKQSSKISINFERKDEVFWKQN